MSAVPRTPCAQLNPLGIESLGLRGWQCVLNESARLGDDALGWRRRCRLTRQSTGLAVSFALKFDVDGSPVISALGFC